MGMYMSALTLSDDKIAALRKNPALIWLIVAPDEPEIYLKETGQTQPPGLFSKIFGRGRKWPPHIPYFEFAEYEQYEVDLDKAWDAINFCLKKLIPVGACKNLFDDGKPVGKIEIGISPALYFTSAEVVEVARRYGAISVEELVNQCQPDEMQDVYPSALWTRDDDENREYLAEMFSVLKDFLAKAEKHGLGVIVQYT